MTLQQLQEVIHGDCLEEMKKMEDNSFDCVITDPPYGMSYQSNWRKEKHQEIVGDSKYPAHLIPEFKRIARKAVFSFCRWDNLIEVEKPKSFIVWVKNNHSSGDLLHEYGRKWEGILFYPLEEHTFNNRPADVIDSRRIPTLFHPTEKPVDLLKWLIRENTLKGDTILDPFMGSGTTLVAAKQLSRKATGIEISEEYCEIARKRLEETQVPIF